MKRPEPQIDQIIGAFTSRDPRYAAFEDPPVTIREFVTLPEYGNHAAVTWPAIVDELEAIFGVDPVRFAHQEAVLEFAIGGGKSHLTSMAFTYMVYWALNLRDPQRYLGLAPGSTIVWLNQSITEDQARRVVFHEVRERILQSPWFLTKKYLPDTRVRSELRFPKHIVVFPGSSSLTFPAGYNLLGGVLDEAAWFDPLQASGGDRAEDPADVIYESMLRRVRSRFGDRGVVLAISSPRHASDFIERRYQLVQFGDPDRDLPPPARAYASRKALWETKPGPERDPETGRWQPWDLVPFRQEIERPDGTREVVFELKIPHSLVPDFRSNPEHAKRDLAAIASHSGVGFFWDPEIVWRPGAVPGVPGYNPSRSHPVTPEGQLADWFRPPTTLNSAVVHAHVDLSLSRDCTGLAIGHVHRSTIIAGEVKPVIVVDLMLELRAPAGAQIDFQEVRNLIYAVRDRGFPIKFVTFDGYMSADSIQQFNKRRIEAEVLSVDPDLVSYDTFKECVHEGRLDYYQYRPFYDCVRSLVLVKGKKVDHVKAGKKDVTDAVAAICRTLTERWATHHPPVAARILGPYAPSVGRRMPRRDRWDSSIF
jgi:hypothetical protein